MKNKTPQQSVAKSNTKKFRRLGNLRPVVLILLIPLAVGALTIGAVASGLYYNSVARLGSDRLITQNWQSANDSLAAQQPKYERKFAYYQVKAGQTLEDLSEYFSVTPSTLASMNPGNITTGTTVKIPALEAPYTPKNGPNGLLGTAAVTDEAGVIHITSKYGYGTHIDTNIPEIASFLAPYNAIEQISPKVFRFNRPVSIDGDIRIDITTATVSRIELRSAPNDITCLCFDQSAALIDGVTITSYDPTTKQADDNYSDGRSFVRMKNGRMDTINTTFTRLGNGIDSAVPGSPFYGTQQDGGVYGVSWRISSMTLGKQITTGWVEGSTFEHNYFGAYTFGASGMLWRGNTFDANHVYGLDPHDDSNNALIENNIFKNNEKHGFIVSKRCNYNIIRNNLSLDNKVNGFMLHQDSAYNLIENNVSAGNTDNYVIYESNYNTISNNKSYNASSSHIRVNQSSHNTFITGNQTYGNGRGIFLYDGVTNTLISQNTIQGSGKKLQTNNAQNTVFLNNKVSDIHYDINEGDRMIFGPNTAKTVDMTIPADQALLTAFEKKQ